MKQAGARAIGGLSLLVASMSSHAQYTPKSLLEYYVPDVSFEDFDFFRQKESENVFREFFYVKEDNKYCVHLINRVVVRDNDSPHTTQYVNSACDTKLEDVFINKKPLFSISESYALFEAHDQRIVALREGLGNQHVVEYLQRQQEQTITHIINRANHNKAYSLLQRELGNTLEPHDTHYTSNQ